MEMDVSLLSDILVQFIVGFPSWPSGQEQIGLCILDLHLADGAQTFANSQGSSQSPM